MEIYTYQIGGIILKIESDIVHPFLCRDSFRQFITPETIKEISFRFHSIDLRNEPELPLSEDVISLLSRCSRSGLDSPLLRDEKIQKRLISCYDRPEKTVVELNPTSITILDFFRNELDTYYLRVKDLTLYSFGPGILAPFLPAFSAVMIHSSCLVLNGIAAVFLAPDEGGKTTVVSRAYNGSVLSDDQIILRKENNNYITYGTPWGLITDATHSAKLGGFFLLEQASAFDLNPIKPDEVLEYLWKEHLVHHFLLPRDLKTALFNLLYDACHQVPAYCLRFPKDYVDWDAIDVAMRI